LFLILDFINRRRMLKHIGSRLVEKVLCSHKTKINGKEEINLSSLPLETM
jgi:hypothetical protein